MKIILKRCIHCDKILGIEIIKQSWDWTPCQ